MMNLDIDAIYSEEAEQAVLGGLMMRPELFPEVREVVGAEDFYTETAQCVFRAIEVLDMRQSAIDALTVAAQLGGGEDWIRLLGVLFTNTPATMNVVAYAHIVRDRAKIRRVFYAYRDAESVIANAGVELSARVEAATDMIASAIGIDNASQRTLDPEGFLSRFVERQAEISQAGTSITGLRTGFPDFDRRTKGLHEGELVILAARPSMGKTNMMLNWSYAIAKQKAPVLMFSLEMRTDELLQRMCAAAKNASYEDIQTASEESWPALTAFVSECQALPLYINDNSTQTIASITSEAKKIKRKHGLSAVFVDYLQLIDGPGKNQNEKVSAISRGLKLLARTLDVPVVALSQLSRDVEKRADKRPVMSDLRDSGSIEQDADVVTFLYREAAYNDNLPPDRQNVAELITRKLRHGQIGSDPLITDFGRCRFLSAATDDLPANWDSTYTPTREKAL